MPSDAGERWHYEGISSPAFQNGSSGAEVSFHNSIIGIISLFIKVELKEIYCSYSRTQKVQNGFL